MMTIKKMETLLAALRRISVCDTPAGNLRQMSATIDFVGAELADARREEEKKTAANAAAEDKQKEAAT